MTTQSTAPTYWDGAFRMVLGFQVPTWEPRLRSSASLEVNQLSARRRYLESKAMPPSPHTASLQWQQLDILIPAIAAMILQPEIPLTRMSLISHIELVHRPIRTLIHFRPFIKVNSIDFLAVQFDLKSIAVAGNQDLVPFTHWLHCISRRFDQVVDRTGIMKPCRRRVIDCDFNPVKTYILIKTGGQRKCSHKDATVTLLRNPKID